MLLFTGVFRQFNLNFKNKAILEELLLSSMPVNYLQKYVFPSIYDYNLFSMIRLHILHTYSCNKNTITKRKKYKAYNIEPEPVVPRCSVKKYLKIFTKLTAKHLCLSPFFVTGCNFIKKRILQIFLKYFFYRTPWTTASVRDQTLT